MANTYPKANIVAGDDILAAQAAILDQQADYIEADLAAGRLPIKATALTDTIALARLPNVVKPIFLSAGGGSPTTTAGCAPPAKLELPTNDVMLVSANFDPTNQEHMTWMFILPAGYNQGSFTPVFYWTAASGSGGVCWGLLGRSIGDGEAIDQALGTAVEVVDTFQGANVLHAVTAGAMTLAGTPAGGELCVIKAYRKPSHASDTLAVDAKLIGIYLAYTGAVSD